MMHNMQWQMETVASDTVNYVLFTGWTTFKSHWAIISVIILWTIDVGR